MKNLSINVVKNVAINELACTPNTIILAKKTISERNGEVTTSVRYLEVCNTEKSDGLTVVKSLLKYCVAEYFVCSEFETEFADTNIKQRKIFNQFLATNTIYRTNAEGVVVDALVSEVPLNQTALKVTNKHTITNCKKENLKSAIHQHAKAILAQCKHVSMITKRVEKLETDLEAKVETEPKKQTKKPAPVVSAPVVSPTPMVAAPAM